MKNEEENEEKLNSAIDESVRVCPMFFFFLLFPVLSIFLSFFPFFWWAYLAMRQDLGPMVRHACMRRGRRQGQRQAAELFGGGARGGHVRDRLKKLARELRRYNHRQHGLSTPGRREKREREEKRREKREERREEKREEKRREREKHKKICKAVNIL